jgi:methyltransferase
MNVLWVVLALVALQRAAELAYAHRNTELLRRRGGVEWGASHYSLVVLLHAAWLISMAALIPPLTPPIWALLGVYAALQVVRVWIIASLGPYWTTRIITVPNSELVRSGPYRFLRHPNYVVVCAEIAVLPLAFGAIGIAVAFSVLNGALLWWRISVEERALATLARPAMQGRPLPPEKREQPES